LINYSKTATLQIKEELVLKIIILAEKFAEDILFYIDVVVRLIDTSGDFITEDIWYRIIQIISGFGKQQNSELQRICANRLFRAINIPHVHETLVKIGSYILAEYGVQLKKEPFKIFDAINRHFNNCSAAGKAMLLNSYVKLAHVFPELESEVQSVLEIHTDNVDPDLQ